MGTVPTPSAAAVTLVFALGLGGSGACSVGGDEGFDPTEGGTEAAEGSVGDDDDDGSGPGGGGADGGGSAGTDGEINCVSSAECGEGSFCVSYLRDGIVECAAECVAAFDEESAITCTDDDSCCQGTCNYGFCVQED